LVHEINKVTRFERIAPFTLLVEFGDGSRQVIDFRPVLVGELYGPLSEPRVFDAVRLDKEAGTLVWPNGADFDLATLHDWPETGPAFAKLARSWVATK